MQFFGGRSLQASYAAGGYVSVPLVTNKTYSVSGAIPLNRQVMVKNVNGSVYIQAA
jgi:hypothetical protein